MGHFSQTRVAASVKGKSEELISLANNPTSIFGIVSGMMMLFADDDVKKEEAKIPEEIVTALSNLQNSLRSKMNISNDIVRMREDIIKNKRLNKEQFIEINHSILTMARDSFLNHFQGWKGVESYFDQKQIT